MSLLRLSVRLVQRTGIEPVFRHGFLPIFYLNYLCLYVLKITHGLSGLLSGRFVCSDGFDISHENVYGLFIVANVPT